MNTSTHETIVCVSLSCLYVRLLYYKSVSWNLCMTSSIDNQDPDLLPTVILLCWFTLAVDLLRERILLTVTNDSKSLCIVPLQTMSSHSLTQPVQIHKIAITLMQVRILYFGEKSNEELSLFSSHLTHPEQHQIGFWNCFLHQRAYVPYPLHSLLTIPLFSFCLCLFWGLSLWRTCPRHLIHLCLTSLVTEMDFIGYLDSVRIYPSVALSFWVLFHLPFYLFVHFQCKTLCHLYRKEIK